MTLVPGEGPYIKSPGWCEWCGTTPTKHHVWCRTRSEGLTEGQIVGDGRFYRESMVRYDWTKGREKNARWQGFYLGVFAVGLVQLLTWAREALLG